MNRLLITASLAALVSGGVVSQAFAEYPTVIKTGAVKTRDLDLATRQGARTLVRRVAAKARDLCTQIDSPVAHGSEKPWRACVTKAVAASVSRIDAPMVTAEYTRMYGTAPSLVAGR